MHYRGFPFQTGIITGEQLVLGFPTPLSMRILTFCLCLLAFPATAQTGRLFQRDVDSLSLILQSTPSFQEQITGEKRQKFDRLVQWMRQDTANVKTPADAFMRMIYLFSLLRDNHLGFYQVPETVLNRASWSDTAAVRRYKATAAFRQYLRVRVNLDSLETALRQAPDDSLEGIYHYGGHLTIGLYQVHPKMAAWYGVVLHSSLPVWEPGQIAVYLLRRSNKRYLAVYGHPVYKNLMLYPNEALVNRSLAGSFFYGSVSDDIYRKHPEKQDFVRISRKEAPFQFRRLSPEMAYVRLGHFSAVPADQKAAEAFLKSIADSLTAPKLLLDLRDNQGGADKVARPFLRIVREYAAKHPVAVLLNYGTMSQGEIFALWLKDIPNVTLLGQPTQGTLTYGSNYGRTVLLPGQTARVYVTDMKSSYLPFEGVGVQPGVILHSDRDWIAQGMEYLVSHP